MRAAPAPRPGAARAHRSCPSRSGRRTSRAPPRAGRPSRRRAARAGTRRAASRRSPCEPAGTRKMSQALSEIPRDRDARRKPAYASSSRSSESSSARPCGGQSGSGASQRLEQWREAMFCSGIRMCPFSSMCGDVVDVAVRGQHAVLVLAAEERDLDLLTLVLVGVVLHVASQSIRRICRPRRRSVDTSQLAAATRRRTPRVACRGARERRARIGPPCDDDEDRLARMGGRDLEQRRRRRARSSRRASRRAPSRRRRAAWRASRPGSAPRSRRVVRPDHSPTSTSRSVGSRDDRQARVAARDDLGRLARPREVARVDGVERLAASRSASARACARPSSFSGGSACPCQRRSRFQSVSPCRTRRDRRHGRLSVAAPWISASRDRVCVVTGSTARDRPRDRAAAQDEGAHGRHARGRARRAASATCTSRADLAAARRARAR